MLLFKVYNPIIQREKVLPGDSFTKEYIKPFGDYFVVLGPINGVTVRSRLRFWRGIAT